MFKRLQQLSWKASVAASLAILAGGFGLSEAAAAKIDNPVAEFKGLDKVTGRLISFDVYMGETVQFGALQVTPKVCYTRPPTETAKTTAFLEVDEVTLGNQVQRIFGGWMFAANPGVHAIEHAVYDVWLVGCKKYSDVPPPENYEGPDVANAPEVDYLAGKDFVSSGVVPAPWPNPLRF
ncbi:DUF2155 domain-containing protein [Flexibacterium corallicola]|uniref:DUF2155 domain-containing protein n=1 Tax=Flexibacterium corallicola TaxID=3037259 RepID=UPI00286EB6E9|nr:DUF2155 domain-containing protein [Pseudovibrio sp. M1P-2-3]